jgi:hypothetical protein
MANSDRSRQKVDEMYCEYKQEERTFDPFGPWEIPKKGLSVGPDKTEIEDRHCDGKNGD